MSKLFDGLRITRHCVKNAKSKEIAGDSLYGWEFVQLSAPDWIKELEAGHTVVMGGMIPKDDGVSYTHAEEYWVGTHFVCADADNLVGVDFDQNGNDENPEGLQAWTEDTGLSERYPDLKNQVYAVGQSVSSMTKAKPHRRYRLIFAFDKPIRTRAEYSAVLHTLHLKFPIICDDDRQPAQPVFGNARPETGKFHICGNILKLDGYLAELEPEQPEPEQTQPLEVSNPVPTTTPTTPTKSLTLDEFISENSIATIKPRPKGGHFVECPYQSEHASGKNTETDAYIWENPDGTFAFYCSHSTCKQKGRNTWQSFRDKVAPKTCTPAPPNEQSHKPASDDPVTHNLVECITAKDLGDKEFPALRWVVDDLIPEGLTVLAGAPKIGKSFLCWNIALAVAQQGVALSRYEVLEKKNVLYFALEDPQRQIQSRLHMIQPDMNLPENISIYTRFPIIFGENGLEAWEQTITKHDAELVIIDTMHHVLPQSDKGTAYQQDYKVLAPIQQMVHRLGISMILVTHTRKAADVENPYNQIQGSVGVQAACDTMMMLVTNDGEKTLHVRGREVMDIENAVEISGGTFICTGVETRNEKNLGDTRQAILDLLRDAGEDGLQLKEIVEGIGEENNTSIRSAVRRMVQDGQIYQPKKRGKYYLDKPNEFQTETDEVDM